MKILTEESKSEYIELADGTRIGVVFNTGNVDLFYCAERNAAEYAATLKEATAKLAKVLRETSWKFSMHAAELDKFSEDEPA